MVREALGWVPLVTPTSQIVGTQAMMNVKFGRWKMICQPAQDIALGKYGRTPGPIDPTVLAQVERQTGKKPITDRPADLLPPGLEKVRAECVAKGLPGDDETAVLYAMFPQQVEALLKGGGTAAAPAATAAPAAAPVAAPSAAPKPAAKSGPGRNMVITLQGQRHEVRVEELES